MWVGAHWLWLKERQENRKKGVNDEQTERTEQTER